MKIVKTYDDLLKYANEWQPKFTKAKAISEASDHINFPHEDYPEFVDQTEKAIKEATYLLENNKKVGTTDIQTLHTICMDGKIYIPLGKFRTIQVKIENNIVFPEPYMIPSMLMSIMPIGLNYQKNEAEILDWYKKFETIHPFEDGNGRVGGVILAAMTYLLTGEYLVPKMEFNFTINPILDRITNSEDVFLNNKKYFDINKSYEERCLYYLSEKLNNVKFKKILETVGSLDDVKTLIENEDLDTLIKLLKEIK